MPDPVADAGPDRLDIERGATVVLDGSGSFDPAGGTFLAFEWRFVSRPIGSSTELTSASTATPSFFADVVGDYEVELGVEDDTGRRDPTPDRTIVSVSDPAAVYVQLTWDADSDLDLHLVRDGGAMFSTESDTYYCNPNPEWGEPGPDDNPVLEADSIHTFGPEIITISAPADGEYSIKIHYFDRGHGACQSGTCPTATVQIIVDGVETVHAAQLTNVSDVWNLGTVNWPERTFTFDGSFGSNDSPSCAG